MAVPYTFGSATAAIPLSNLDSNFATTITLGNTAIQLGNTVSTLNNMTLANVSISSGNVTLTNVTVTTANVTTGNVTTLAVGSGGVKSGGSVVVGTTDWTNTAVTGAIAVNGYGVYPYVTQGATNTAGLGGIIWYTPTAFAGTNGASSQVLQPLNIIQNLKNDGSGGTSLNTGYAITANSNVESTGVAARVRSQGILVSSSRYSATDLSTRTDNTVFGITVSVNHNITAPSTIVSANLQSLSLTNNNNSGTASTHVGVGSSITVGTTAGAPVTSSSNALQFYSSGFSVGLSAGNAATVTTGASFYASGPSVAATGTMTTYYGLYLGAASVTGTLTNNWGVYSEDTAAKNYFGGNVGIGTTSPSYKLDVTGNIRATTGFVTDAANGLALFTGDPGNYNISRSGTTVTVKSAANVELNGGVLRFLISSSEAMRVDSVGSVGIGTGSPNASALLDVQSTTKGMRMPNMTTTQKNAISSPAAGLMVFDTTLAKLCVYSGAAWQTITSV